jgi:hypothetical protein
MPFTNYVVSQQDAIYKSSIENVLNSFFGGPAILMSKFVSIPVMKNYFEPGIISTFKGFDSTEESAEIFNRSFVGNACEYYETVYNSTHDGL